MTSEGYPWYASVEGDGLAQGDLLYGCTHLGVLGPQGSAQETSDVVVLSHSCDLNNDKLQVAQVCPFWGLSEIAESVEYFRGRRGREDLRRGHLPGYHLLNRCYLPGLETDFLVCEFRSLFGVRVGYLKQLAAAQSPRRRLLPPYREHLAQAFARFFMRVGLPIDVPSFQ